MTTTEQIQELQSAVTALQNSVSSLSNQLSTETNSIELDVQDCESDITSINNQISQLTSTFSAEDTLLHQEIHTISLGYDNHNTRLNTLEVDNVLNQTNITNLTQADNYLQQEIDDMDVEHHQEIHLLSQAIDAHTTRLNSLELFAAETPSLEVLSETAYDNLGEPDYNTFYFIYEED